MKLFIKNAMSHGSKTIIKKELNALGIPHIILQPGEIKIKRRLLLEQQHRLRARLLKHGLDLMDDRQSKLIEQVKKLIIEITHHIDERPVTNYSHYISERLQYDYTYLSNLFSEVHNTTIEQCIIAHKIERVKQLLLDSDLTLTKIAYKLHYSSVSHLSNQFKKVTGITTSRFKKQQRHKKPNLNEICD